ncbi:immune inhibitor A domain-containing protein [Agromyces aurantiacus]|uniref:Immune inhibitor A domain-containing protein n=1 Tax=Agromyces aurantiacus TaxID=165814 RepID=A0ABV9R154_9MICO|nr:immune inhibitor A domain-containing protein [Agromyces aurantiacus]MBM7505877.1 immune inhibitor A [Agromyces aurantiacus]
MNRRTRGVLAVAAASATMIAGAAFGQTAIAAPANDLNTGSAGAAAARPDNRPGPLTERQNERRKAAQELILSGQAAPNEDGVVHLAEDKYYEAAVTGTGRLFTILSEFGDQGSGKLGTDPGPLHNQIPEPGSDNNSTHWRPNFDSAYYDDLFFGPAPSFADFYTKQSSGNYTVAGEVSDWVQVPNNESTYGDNSVEDYGGAWQFIEDSGNAWYDEQKANGMTDADIKAELAQFDVWDRYDYDADGNFDEPDGYLDHFQAVHAGEGEDAGGGAQGEDAIWSHRWYVNATDYGQTGPTVGGTQVKFGGAQIGDTGYWIGDYTVEAENGGLGVFAHEYAHDLGLPDFYDTAGGENSTAFWTLMSSGSWLGDGTVDIGTKPNYMGPWEKLQLGWLDYAVVNPGQSGDYTLSPAARQVDGQEQALVVDVPDQGITSEYTTPASGTHAWWTGSADDLNSTLTRTVDLSGIRSATVTAKAWYDIEAGYDYLYAEYRPVGTTDWKQIGSPIDGSTNGKWSTVRFSIPGGANTEFRFRYQTDGGVHYAGAFLDDITIKNGGTTLFSDDVEQGDNGWTAAGGFKVSTGTETSEGDRYYLVENRTYVDYDATLETGPYQFDKAYTAPDHVEHFKFQDGMLVWAVDEAYGDNNTIEHQGHGLALPVDADPVKFTYDDGTGPSNRRQPFDATFGLQTIDRTVLHKEVLSGKGKNQTVVTKEAVGSDGSETQTATFSDKVEDAYFSSTNPLGGVMVAGHGVTVTVKTQTTGGTMTVSVVNPQ